jgi:hypothetical protein
MSSSNWRDGGTADHHGRDGDAVAFNEDLKDGAIYEKDAEERSLRGFA